PPWRARAEEIRGRVRDVIEHLGDVGLDVTLDPSATLMFRITAAGQRQPLADGEACPDARELSPGVLLRPLWQDAIFPTAGFVVGPGELAYLAVVGSLYRLLGVPRPAFVPRAPLTLVEPSLKKPLDRFGGAVADLAAGPDGLAGRVLGGGESQPEQVLTAAIEELQGRLATVLERVRQVDLAMAGPVERSRSKVVEELDKLRQKMRN